MTHQISRSDLINALQEYGFLNVDKRPRQYAESWQRHTVLVNVKSHDSNPLVIHPQNESQLDVMQSIRGVIPGERPYCHNSQFSGFPKHIHTGQTEVHYGIDFGFESLMALNAFLKVLCDEEVDDWPDAEQDIVNATDLPEDETERRAVVAARRGQGVFRKRLDEHWQSCAVTGCIPRELLRASHIQPWRDSSNADRLNPDNGLLLAAHLDAAFDRGLVSFGDDGRILINHSRLPATDAEMIGILPTMQLRAINAEHRPFLAIHRRIHGFVA